MKYLIVGLGNIGADYDNTRHNIGFDVADAFVEEASASFDTARLGELAKFKYRGKSIFVLKPSTYMNLSGKAVQYWMQKEKISAENLLVLVDDLNIDFGKIRVRTKGSDGGHNGLKNINQLIGSKYPRLRFGIGSNFSKGKQVNFVLGKWSDEEADQLPELIKRSVDICKSFIANGVNNTMNQYNN